jgi:serine/threonine-protein kinase RsbT
MGLAGARRLMDEFEVTSEEGKGTTVTMKKWKSVAGP